jgi:3-hydroxyisobutyrate dehydrogenase-like beta-hydroxyacid dehydrogenase
VTSILLLHPGEMGASVGAALRSVGHDVAWVAAQRSATTARRAASAGLTAVGAVHEAADADVVVSVCPPAAAPAVAAEVADTGFAGVYVDANAISPATSAELAELVGASGIAYVDGGIVGPPALQAGTTRLFLSGEQSPEVAGLWSGSVLEAVVVGGGVGGASALKMCFASSTKVHSALLLAIATTASHHGVLDELLAEWDRRGDGRRAALERSATASAPKAWRWVAEMEEIAATFAAAGMPSGFGLGAAAVFARMRDGVDADPPPGLDAVLTTLSTHTASTSLGSLAGQDP